MHDPLFRRYAFLVRALLLLTPLLVGVALMALPTLRDHQMVKQPYANPFDTTASVLK